VAYHAAPRRSRPGEEFRAYRGSGRPCNSGRSSSAPSWSRSTCTAAISIPTSRRSRSPPNAAARSSPGARRSSTCCGAPRARSHEHNLLGRPGTQVVPELFDPGDVVVDTKKRYNAYLHTDLEFVLRDLGARTVLLAGVNTNSCILCSAFETVNRDFELVVVEDCVDSMDGEEAHQMALALIRTALGRVMRWEELRETLGIAGELSSASYRSR
jgi:nicotinamidase-related amidase